MWRPPSVTASTPARGLAGVPAVRIMLVAAHGAGPKPVGPRRIAQADLDPLLRRALVAELGQPHRGA